MGSEYLSLTSKGAYDDVIEGGEEATTIVPGSVYRPKHQRWTPLFVLSLALNAFFAVFLVGILRNDLDTDLLAEDINGFVPKFDREQVLFSPGRGIAAGDSIGSPGNITSMDVMSLIPIGRSFVHVPNYASYQDLPDPIEFNSGQTGYAVAVLHQLHCLSQIIGEVTALRESCAASGGSGGGGLGHWHIDHCADYLQQSIRCCGDTTLEGPGAVAKGRGTDGNGATHTCKKYKDIYDWAENLAMPGWQSF